MRHASWGLGFSLLAGCTALLGYPEPGSGEDTFELCHDGVDNDLDDVEDCDESSCDAHCEEVCTFEPPATGERVDEDRDGLFDCADPSCDGSCPEDLLEACSDRRDQDGDGLVDLADPGCWSYADVRIESCTSVPALDRVFDFDGDDEAWAHPPGALRPDPTGHFPGNSLVIEPGDPQEPINLGEELPGAVVGLRVTTSVYFDPASSYLALGIVVADEPLELLSLNAWTGRDAFGRPVLSLITSNSHSFVDPALPFTGPPGWYEVELRIEDSGAVLRVEDETGGEVFSLRSTIGAFRPSHLFTLYLNHSTDPGSSSPVVVGEVRWHSPAYEPCGVEIPVRPRPPRGVYSTAVISGETLCALGDFLGSQFGVQRTRSMNRGELFSDEGRIAGTESNRVVGAFARAGEPIEVLLSGIGAGRSTLTWARTADCLSLERDGTFEAPGDPVIGVASRDGLYDLIRSSGSFSASGRLTVERVTREGELRDVIDLGEIPAGSARAVMHGNDVLLTNLSEVGTLWAISAGPRSSRAPRQFGAVTPSRRAGACDAQSVQGVSIVLDPEPVEADALTTGLLVFPCEPWCSFSSRSCVRLIEMSGLVAHRFSIRAR